MAPGFYSAVPPPPSLTPGAAPPQTPQTPQHQHQSHTPLPTTTTPIDIDAWTVSAFASLSVSPLPRGAGKPLFIPLDEEDHDRDEKKRAVREARDRLPPIRRPLSARDSVKRREEMRKGKEGSRQRRRWENDRLVGVPNAQPPQPIDMLPRATHPVTHTPYHIAQYWDASVRQRVEDRTAALQAARKRQQLTDGSATGLGAGEVSRELRENAKRIPVLKGWVRGLEGPVRQFVVEQRRGAAGDGDGESGGSSEEEDEEDEVLFAGRKSKGAGRNRGPEKGVESETGWKRARKETSDGQVKPVMVYEAPGKGETAALKRWITHAISDYYGLRSESVDVGNTGRRVVYLELRAPGKRPKSRRLPHLPRPLWELC